MTSNKTMKAKYYRIAKMGVAFPHSGIELTADVIVVRFWRKE